MKRKVAALEWTGDHDALQSGYIVTLECGHSFFRPTNILTCRSIGRKLEEDGAFCKECVPVYHNDETQDPFLTHEH